MQRFLRLSIATFVLCLCVPACGDDDDSAGDASAGDGGGNDAGGTSDAGGKTDAGGGGASDIEIAGDWDNNYGMEEVITNTMWATFKLISFDNDTNIAITQNADDGTDFAKKFNKTVWIEPTNDGFAYCQFAFGKDTAADAEKEKDTTDPKKLENGCGGFGWTIMKPHKPGSGKDAGGGEDGGADSDAGN
jgi:hypothetical protein